MKEIVNVKETQYRRNQAVAALIEEDLANPFDAAYRFRRNSSLVFDPLNSSEKETFQIHVTRSFFIGKCQDSMTACNCLPGINRPSPPHINTSRRLLQNAPVVSVRTATLPVGTDLADL